MKGLLIKDLCLLKGQKRFFLVVLALAILSAFSTKDVTFIVGYVTLILPMFSLSTISYDEFDNGNAFLFTLPFSKAEYVLEKYLFSLLTGVFSAVFSVIVACIVGGILGNIPFQELLVSAPIMLAFMLVIHSILLPINIKFGAEKSRTAMLVVSGTVLVLGTGFAKLLEIIGVDFVEIGNFLFSNIALTVGIAIFLIIVILAISIKSSISIIKKKEF